MIFKFKLSYNTLTLILFLTLVQTEAWTQQEFQPVKNKFKYIEVKSHFGAFLKSDNDLGNSGVLDNGYGGVTVKIGWQPTDSDGWYSKYSYPSYGIGLYSGFLADASIFGNPNAIYGFVNFPISHPERRNSFSIQPSFGLTYNLNPFDSEENPINSAIGARAAVYFNIDFGFSYKFSRELDLLYGFDLSHFSNGSTYQPNNGLNLYGINLGLRYHFNPTQFKVDNDPYSEKPLPARFNRPLKSTLSTTNESRISLYLAAGVGQRDEDAGTGTLYGALSVVMDYEHQFNEMHGITGGFDLFYDNRLRTLETSDRYIVGVHAGYDFNFWRFAIKFQLGTYINDDRGKGAFFMRPALRYNLSKLVFAQVGLKTLDGGAADYIEYGIGIKPFNW